MTKSKSKTHSGRQSLTVSLPVAKPEVVSEGQDSQGTTTRAINSILRVYDSASQCANARGIPLAVLKWARKEGCEAFKNNRVDLDLFLRWHFARDIGDVPESGGTWSDELNKFKAKREQIRLEVDRGEILVAQEVVTAMARAEAVGEKFLARMVDELPGQLEGREAAYIEQKLTEMVDALTKERKMQYESILKQKPQEEVE